MVKRTQNVRICLNEFHHFVGLPFKGLRLLATTPKSSTSVSSANRNNLFVWNLHSLNLMSHLLIQNLLVCLFKHLMSLLFHWTPVSALLSLLLLFLSNVSQKRKVFITTSLFQPSELSCQWKIALTLTFNKFPSRSTAIYMPFLNLLFSFILLIFSSYSILKFNILIYILLTVSAFILIQLSVGSKY